MISIILPILLIGHVQAYPNGAPTSACGDMVPQHGGSDQTGPLPVTWTIANNCYQTSQPITVAFTSTGFKGLLLRLVYNVEGFENAAGNFVADNTNGNYQLIACGGQQSSGLTHVTSSQKTSFSYNFQPQAGISSPFTIYLTLVVSKNVFWVKQAYTLPQCPVTPTQSASQTQAYAALVTSTSPMTRVTTPADKISTTINSGESCICGNHIANLALDNNPNTYSISCNKECSNITNLPGSWWVDLSIVYPILGVSLTASNHDYDAKYLDGLSIYVSQQQDLSNRQLCTTYNPVAGTSFLPRQIINLNCNSIPTLGRYVIIERNNRNSFRYDAIGFTQVDVLRAITRTSTG